MALLKEVTAIQNGARFHSVDLHIHTYGGSHDVQDPTMTPEAIVDAAVRQGLSVIAITDHNSSANVQKAIDHSRQAHGDLILVLPGVEITTAHGHLLVYFPPEKASELTRFLMRLDLVGDMGAESTRTAKSMADVISEADRLGGICIAAHIDRGKSGFDAFAPGFQNWKKDILSSPGLYGLECDTVDALRWYSDQDEPGSEGAERKKLLSARRSVPALSSRPSLAHVQGSDAHSMVTFENQRPNKPWTRMKLTDLSFSAFRVALIDPTARVRASAALPRSVPRLRGVAFTGGFLHGEIFHFSDNLNCIVGGRGTGKSTAIRAIAYAFGLNDDFSHFDNCPDSVTVFAESDSGVLYRYTRAKGGDIEVKAKEDGSITDVPTDVFRIEYFGQGELARVADDPIQRPELLQDFLDRHTNLQDLLDRESSLSIALRENAGRLGPLETASQQLPAKKQSLEEIETKLKLAEEGNLRDVVAIQSQLASERTVRESVDTIAADYARGHSLANVRRDFDQILTAAGTCTSDPSSTMAIAEMGTAMQRCNAAIERHEAELNTILRGCATELRKLVAILKGNHQRMSAEVAITLADLKARGLATDIPGLESLLRQKTAVAKDIALVEQRAEELRQTRQQRSTLRKELMAIREEMTARRKRQLASINTSLAQIIKDYTVFLKYDPTGITTAFQHFMQQKMQGTYLQDVLIEQLCSRTTPSDLADLVLNRDAVGIANVTQLTIEWADKIISRLNDWPLLFELQALAKQPRPVITVRTKADPPKSIPLLQLSDGQRHTILLTIAMLAESNVPLVIDQPEDDLDNAFIFTTVVATLRAVKERRQVILVTHNANIAVLGDSELILPMYRESDVGKAKDRGSIDSDATKRCVLEILEGGSEAFLRRKEMYNH